MDLSELSTEELRQLVTEAQRELSRRSVKSPVTVLKEFCDQKGWQVQYEYCRGFEKGWHCRTRVAASLLETISDITAYHTGTKREAKRKAAKETMINFVKKNLIRSLWIPSQPLSKPLPRGEGGFRSAEELRDLMDKYKAGKNGMAHKGVKAWPISSGVPLEEYPELPYDYDHEDENGNPIPPPVRTAEEEIALKEQLDRELDEYAAERDRILAKKFSRESDEQALWSGELGEQPDIPESFDFLAKVRGVPIHGGPEEIDCSDEDCSDEDE